MGEENKGRGEGGIGKKRGEEGEGGEVRNYKKKREKNMKISIAKREKGSGRRIKGKKEKLQDSS